MLGSSKTGREYNQDQILLNSVSSIGIPLSLATSSNTSNLIHPATSLSLNTTNSLAQTSSSTSLIVSSTNSLSDDSNNYDNVSNKNREDDNTKKEKINKGLTDTSKTENKEQELDLGTGETDLDISSDLKNSLSSVTDDITFKFTETTINNLSTETTINPSSENDKLDDNLTPSFFFTSSIPLNLDDLNDPDRNDYLSGTIDMDIDLINDLNIDIDPDIATTEITSKASSSVAVTTTVTDNDTTAETAATITTATTATTTDTSTTAISAITADSAETATTITTPVLNETTNNTVSDSLLLKKNMDSTKNLDDDTKESNDLLLKDNSLNSITSVSIDKNDLLKFVNSGDLENNIKLLSNQSLLLPNQKKSSGNVVPDFSNGIPTSNESSLTKSAALSMMPISGVKGATVTANSGVTTATSATSSMALNPAINIDGTQPKPTIQVESTIPANRNNLLTAPNPIMALPSMMNNIAYYNPGVPTNIPGRKVSYYPPPNAMIKAPPQGEVILKKAYNGIIKQENINDLKKNPPNGDAVLKNQLSTGKINLKELSEANPNVKINMKSVKSGAPKGRRVQSRNASLRPTLSYVELITEAICDSEDGLLSLQEIYDAIKRKYVYFRTADPAWQNSIRHNLSVHQSFTKITRPPNRPGKGFLWTSSKIDYKNLSADSRKRRKREHGDKPHPMGQTTQATKNPSYHATYTTSSASNVQQQNASNNMNDINYILNQQQQQPRVSQKVLKILTDNSINTPSLKQLLFTGFKHMSNDPYHHHNGINYSLNSFDGYHSAAHSTSLYTGSQYLTNSSGFPTQMANSSMPLSLNSLIMPSPAVSSSLSNSSTAFTKGSSSSYQNSYASSNSTLALPNMDNVNHQKYSSGSSLYSFSLLDPEYSRYSQSLYRSYYYPKNDVLMHNNNRRYSFDSAMTSSAAFAAAAAAAAHNNSNPNAPSPPFYSLAKSQSAKNVTSGPNYIKKDREKKIMYEKMNMHNDYNNMVNQPPSQFVGNTSSYIGSGTAAPLNYGHKHLPANYGNNVQAPAFNATNPIQSTKSLKTPIIYETKTEHGNLESTKLSASTVIENEPPIVVTNKEQA